MGAARNRAEEAWTNKRPAMTREARQAYMENLALDLVEKRLLNGEATSQETTHFLKSASTRGRIEELRLKQEVELMKAKQKHIESQEELQQMFKDAIQAMASYRMEDPDADQQYQELPGQ